MCVCVCLCGFCNVCVCVGFVMCFFLSCKTNAMVKLAKTVHGPHSSTLVVICVVWLFVMFCALFVCKCVLPPGDNPTAVNLYPTNVENWTSS
jgi:apolipoprotein N-acyltransferase